MTLTYAFNKYVKRQTYFALSIMFLDSNHSLKYILN